MRNMYQSTFGALMKNAGLFKYLQVWRCFCIDFALLSAFLWYRTCCCNMIKDTKLGCVRVSCCWPEFCGCLEKVSKKHVLCWQDCHRWQCAQRLSEEKGARMDSPASKADIKKFLKAYEGQVSIEDIADDLDSFECFNAFFYRKCVLSS